MDQTIQNAKRADKPQDASNQQKDPADWVTGGEPVTGAQASYLKTLSEQAHTDVPDVHNKGEASQQIDALRQRTGK